MSVRYKKSNLFLFLFKSILVSPFLFYFLNPNSPNSLKAAVEFQWNKDSNFKSLKWHQTENRKSARNKIFLFLRSSDRKTGLLKVNLKVPDRFNSKINKKNISLCEVRVGGFNKKTKCLKNIPFEIEMEKEDKSINIFPQTPIPSSKENYAIVLKVINPNRGGLYQFHSFGQSSGNIPVSFYLGSWTLDVQSQ
tara:strand:- start:53 stop:631 length:579 start_codon:yes stop_codon:yes gene_type:complete